MTITRNADARRHAHRAPFGDSTLRERQGTVEMNHITVTEIAAVVGLIAVAVMAIVMLTMVIQQRTFAGQAPQRMTVQSGSMAIDEEARDVD